jgi:hypothetical protein
LGGSPLHGFQAVAKCHQSICEGFGSPAVNVSNRRRMLPDSFWFFNPLEFDGFNYGESAIIRIILKSLNPVTIKYFQLLLFKSFLKSLIIRLIARFLGFAPAGEMLFYVLTTIFTRPFNMSIVFVASRKWSEIVCFVFSWRLYYT